MEHSPGYIFYIEPEAETYLHDGQMYYKVKKETQRDEVCHDYDEINVYTDLIDWHIEKTVVIYWKVYYSNDDEGNVQINCVLGSKSGFKKVLNDNSGWTRLFSVRTIKTTKSVPWNCFTHFRNVFQRSNCKNIYENCKISMDWYPPKIWLFVLKRRKYTSLRNIWKTSFLIWNISDHHQDKRCSYSIYFLFVANSKTSYLYDVLYRFGSIRAM